MDLDIRYQAIVNLNMVKCGRFLVSVMFVLRGKVHLPMLIFHRFGVVC